MFIRSVIGLASILHILCAFVCVCVSQAAHRDIFFILDSICHLFIQPLYDCEDFWVCAFVYVCIKFLRSICVRAYVENEPFYFHHVYQKHTVVYIGHTLQLGHILTLSLYT